MLLQILFKFLAISNLNEKVSKWLKVLKKELLKLWNIQYKVMFQKSICGISLYFLKFFFHERDIYQTNARIKVQKNLRSLLK